MFSFSIYEAYTCECSSRLHVSLYSGVQRVTSDQPRPCDLPPYLCWFCMVLGGEEQGGNGSNLSCFVLLVLREFVLFR